MGRQVEARQAFDRDQENHLMTRFGSTRQLPSGRWQARFRKAGMEITAPQTFGTQRDAERWLEGQRVDIERGVWTMPSKTLPGSDMPTVAQYAEEWFADRELKPRTRVL